MTNFSWPWPVTDRTALLAAADFFGDAGLYGYEAAVRALVDAVPPALVARLSRVHMGWRRSYFPGDHTTYGDDVFTARLRAPETRHARREAACRRRSAHRNHTATGHSRRSAHRNHTATGHSRRFRLVEFRVVEQLGVTIANTGAFARVDYT